MTHVALGSNGETKTDYNFNYKWTIEKGADYVDIVKVETDPSKKWSKVTVKVKDSIDPFYYDEDNEIEINVAANLVSTSNANNVYQNAYRSFTVTTEYSEISLSSDVPANLEVGKSVTITPSLYWHWVLWDDVFDNTGKSIVSKLDEAKYAWVFDEKVVGIKNQGASISSDDAEEGLYEGSFTITKKRNQGTTIQLVAFLYNDEDKVWEEEVRKEIYLYETEPITNAQVSGIADKTYNGQAQIQNLDIVEKYVEDGEEFLYTLTEGNDYEVTYSNNVNAGKATVTIIGLNSYTGSIVKTFNIAKANQSPSINAAAKKVKLQKGKKKKQNVQPLTVTGAKGTISYKGVGANKKSKKALKINAKTGKITVKKGTKKGTYKMNVTVTVSGNANYNSYTGTKTVTIKVK